MSAIKEVSAANFDLEVKESKLPVLVEFHSPGCGPCKQLQGVLKEYAGEVEGKLEFAGLDISENVEIAAQYGIMAVPCMILFLDGEVKWQYSGFLPKAKIEKHIAKALS